VKRLLVIVPDSLSGLVTKGEIQPRYYNPGNLFEDVHILMTNDDRPDLAALQRTVGAAKLHLHNLPIDWGLMNRKWHWFDAYLLKRWARPAVDLALTIQPHLVRCHGADWNVFAAMRIKEKFRTPYVVSLHINPDVNSTGRILRENLTEQEQKSNEFYEYIERKGLQAADMVMPVYKPIIPYLERMSVTRYQVCYNVLNAEDLREKTDYQISRPVKIISVGRIFEDKDPSNIILAVKDLADAELTIVGDGDLREKLHRLVSDLNMVDRVKFITAIPNTDLCRRLSEYDIFAIHSEYWEINKSLLEALLTGLPCVVNRRMGPQVPELDGNFIMKVENSPENYRSAFEKLISDHAFRESLGRQAYTHAQEKWAPEKTERAYVDIYERLMIPNETNRVGRI
jgi:glycosyltransferase involved in cell wall biosynthesis